MTNHLGESGMEGSMETRSLVEEVVCQVVGKNNQHNQLLTPPYYHTYSSKEYIEGGSWALYRKPQVGSEVDSYFRANFPRFAA